MQVAEMRFLKELEVTQERSNKYGNMKKISV